MTSVRFSIFELSAQADEYFQVSAIKDPKNFFLREIKTDLRNRLAGDTLNDLMLISHHGTDIKDFNPKPAIEIWKSKKIRRFISNWIPIDLKF